MSSIISLFAYLIIPVYLCLALLALSLVLARCRFIKLALWLANERTLAASRSIIKEYLGLLLYWMWGWI